MTVNNPGKTLCGIISLILLECILGAQITVISQPSSGRVAVWTRPLFGWSGTPPYIDGAPPDYSTSTVLSGSALFSGGASVSDCRTNGSISYVSPGYRLFQLGESETNYSKYICADVVPGSRVKVKFNSNLSLNWLDVATSDGAVGASARFDFFAPDGITVLQPYEIKRSNYAQIEGDIPDPKSWAAEVTPSSTWTCEIGGKTYYRLGKFGVSGSAKVEASDASIGSWAYNMNAGYSGEITGVEAYYIGDVLTINGGNNETWLVEQEMPKALSVKVADGETGAPVAASVPITFTILEPANGAKFPGGQTSINVNTENGIAGVKLTLGTVAGTYKVLATCPPEHCTSGAREVTFTEKAVTVQEDTELQLKWCDFVGTAGSPLQNPIKVKTFNKLTGTGVSGFNVVFSVVDDPPSGVYDLNPEIAETKQPYGLAKTIFTPGISYGQYNVRAFCKDCFLKKEVFCPITAGPPKNILKERTKVDPDTGIVIRFEPSSFDIVYGKEVDICAVVDPPDKAEEVSFASGKGGFLTTVNSLPIPGCDSTGKVSLHILSKIDVCILQDSVQALINDVQPVAEVTGNVLLPTSEYAVKKIENSSDCEAMELSPLCKYDAYNILFNPSINVQGLMVKERLIDRRALKNLRFCTDSPAAETQNPIDELNGQFGVSDVNGVNRQSTIPKNCGYQFEQRVYIGACPIQTNSITVEFDGNGNIITTRTDEAR